MITLIVSMPCIGLIPFLPISILITVWLVKCVNALCRAYSISTHAATAYRNYHVTVSMPCVGLIPFLPWGNGGTDLFLDLCQCPVSGLFHFYNAEAFVPANTKVSMPCVGLIPFLHLKNLSSLTGMSVSMPCVGLIPFLRRKGSSHERCSLVSMPCVGLIPFLPIL